MVSGFLTSPCDHSRIFSGEASAIRIALNERGSFGFSKKLKMSFTMGSYTRGSFVGGSAGAAHLVGNFSGERGEPGRDTGSLLGLAARHRRVLDQLDVEAQRLELLEQHVERLRQAGL